MTLAQLLNVVKDPEVLAIRQRVGVAVTQRQDLHCFSPGWAPAGVPEG